MYINVCAKHYVMSSPRNDSNSKLKLKLKTLRSQLSQVVISCIP